MSGASRALLAQVSEIARRAGAEILAEYAAASGETTFKEDASPLTRADLRAHAAIAEALAALTPDIPLLSEESAQVPFAVRARWARHWLVDPLDGTKEFLARNGQFTVNIALIEADTPVLGVVHVPASATTYQGLPGSGAWRDAGGEAPRAIHVAGHSARAVRVVGSRSHRGDSLDGFLHRLGAHELVAVGSSLKFCLVAEGAADVYPRLGPTNGWDTAAAHAVAAAAGATVCALDGTPLRYNTSAQHLNPYFVVYGARDHDWLALLRQPQAP
ncbi:MAG TPA: 3'(2'),5'-bisphosphate nucleotidase CysQ [Steroidobacteraceae bacterium]|jgi:3'(2'), 5'-bisphosphate nucleotidase|nr:3'(2'),5'-bisphosphate nucleotidase CysQ [Steroidobacteraceae bacterium]